MYTGSNNHSSRTSLVSHYNHQMPYSFAGYSNKLSTPYENRMSCQGIYSFPLHYDNQTPTKSTDDNYSTTAYNSEISKLQEINQRISKTTESIVNSRKKPKSPSEINHHPFSKQPQTSQSKYRRQYIRYQQSPFPSFTNYNCGIQNQINAKTSNQKVSEGKKIRKNSVKVNFLYENSGQQIPISPTVKQQQQRPQRDKSVRSISIQPPSSTYHSTDLILSQKKGIMETNYVNKYANFSYPHSGINQDDDSGDFQKRYSREDVFYDMSSPSNKTKVKKSQQEISKPKIPVDHIKKPQTKPTQNKFSNMKNLLSQIKSGQNKLVAIILIVLAIMIFILQLFS